MRQRDVVESMHGVRRSNGGSDQAAEVFNMDRSLVHWRYAGLRLDSQFLDGGTSAAERWRCSHVSIRAILKPMFVRRRTTSGAAITVLFVFSRVRLSLLYRPCDRHFGTDFAHRPLIPPTEYFPHSAAAYCRHFEVFPSPSSDQLSSQHATSHEDIIHHRFRVSDAENASTHCDGTHKCVRRIRPPRGSEFGGRV